MNYYQQEVLRIRDEHIPKQYQVNRIIAAKHFIDMHSSRNIGLEEIAGSACLSKFHFIRLFKRCYGRTPHQYLTEQKMAQAKLLLQSGMPVFETSFLLGFVSTTSFTGLFKKATGLTPSGYQQKKQFSRA